METEIWHHDFICFLLYVFLIVSAPQCSSLFRYLQCGADVVMISLCPGYRSCGLLLKGGKETFVCPQNCWGSALNPINLLVPGPVATRQYQIALI